MGERERFPMYPSEQRAIQQACGRLCSAFGAHAIVLFDGDGTPICDAGEADAFDLEALGLLERDPWMEGQRAVRGYQVTPGGSRSGRSS